MNAQRTTRGVRWQIALALIAVSALALTTGVALAGQQSHKND